jgi:hypothetical protein
MHAGAGQSKWAWWVLATDCAAGIDRAAGRARAAGSRAFCRTPGSLLIDFFGQASAR